MNGEISLEYLVTLLLWIAVPGYFFLRSYTTKHIGVGLLLAYCLQLALIHLTGALLQILPWYTSQSRADTLAGFPITGFALLGLLAGYVLAQPGVLRRSSPGVRTEPVVLQSPEIGWICIAVGLVAYFGVPLVLSFASLASVVSNGLNLAAIGFCYEWWFYYRSGRIQIAWQIASGIFILPILTVLLMGFLGYGINSVVLLGAFVAVSGVPRRTILTGGAVLAFSMLSLYVVYMGVRNQIREAVWGNEDISKRAAVVSSNVQNTWEWFSLSNFNQLDQIEDRLNQNRLLGAAVRELQAGHVKFAEGETLQNILLSLVPRIVWPNKPTFAGSGSLVTRFTGIKFEATTSVGIGHVMELYVNYGKPGVFIGFIGIGLLLSVLDIAAGGCLYRGKTAGFLFYMVAGSAFLTVGGVLAESPPAFVGSIALTLLVTKLSATTTRNAVNTPSPARELRMRS
jgi:hypothetical protein